MISQVSEQFILFIHVVKWLVLASIVGILVGITSTGFVLGLNLVIDRVSGVTWAYWLLPLGLAFSAWFTSALVPAAERHRRVQPYADLVQPGDQLPVDHGELQRGSL